MFSWGVISFREQRGVVNHKDETVHCIWKSVFISRQYQSIELKRNHALRLYFCRRRSDLCISVVLGAERNNAEPNGSYFSSKLTFIRSLLRDFCSGVKRWKHCIARLHQLIRQPICWGIYRARHWRTYTRLTRSSVKLISYKRSTEMRRAANMHKAAWNTEGAICAVLR